MRKKYGIEPGTTVEIRDAEGKIILLPNILNPVEKAFGMLADDGPSFTQELLAEVFLSLINLGETAYITERRRGAEVAMGMVEKVYNPPAALSLSASFASHALHFRRT